MNINSRVYSEVDYILENIDEELKAKIPEKLLQHIKKCKSKYYIPEIELNSSLEEQKLEHKTIILLAMIYYNCWCENDEEKQELIKLFRENEV